MFTRQVNRGRSIVHSTERYKNYQNSLADVLLDLMHWARQDGIDFDDELASAREYLIEDMDSSRQRIPVCTNPMN